MEYILILLFFSIIVFSGFINWKNSNKKDFRYLIEPELEKYGLKYIKADYPGLFKVGPFKKFEIEIGKLQINDGGIQYEQRYYRKVTALTNDNKEVVIWAKIDTGWFKEDAVEFSPKLKDLKSVIRKQS